jgi:hypothetical protein
MRDASLDIKVKMQSWSFISELALLPDELDVLKNLSLYLESGNASVVDAEGHLETYVKHLQP